MSITPQIVNINRRYIYKKKVALHRRLLQHAVYFMYLDCLAIDNVYLLYILLHGFESLE